MFFFGVFDGGFNNKTYSFNISVYLCNPLSMLIPLLCGITGYRYQEESRFDYWGFFLPFLWQGEGASK